MSAAHFEYEKKASLGARLGIVAAVVTLLGVGVLFVRQMMAGKSTAMHRPESVVTIQPVAAPPPPPPPPPQPIPKQQVDEQTQVTEDDLKPAEEAADEPSPELGTGITGNGPPDGFGLGKKDRGMIAGTGAGGAKGSRFGGYFSRVVAAVTEALGRHAATRTASFDVHVRIWSDPTGRITRVNLLQSTGRKEVDDALRTDALVGCQLPDLPADLRLPLELRLNLRRPN